MLGAKFNFKFVEKMFATLDSGRKSQNIFVYIF